MTSWGSRGCLPSSRGDGRNPAFLPLSFPPGLAQGQCSLGPGLSLPRSVEVSVIYVARTPDTSSWCRALERCWSKVGAETEAQRGRFTGGMRAETGHGVTLQGPAVQRRSPDCQASTLSKAGKFPATGSRIVKGQISQISTRIAREQLAGRLEVGRAVTGLPRRRTGNGRAAPSERPSGRWHGLNGGTCVDKASLPFPSRHVALTWPWFISR